MHNLILEHVFQHLNVCDHSSDPGALEKDHSQCATEGASLLWRSAVMCVKIPKTGDEISTTLFSPSVHFQVKPKRKMKMICNNHNTTVSQLEILQLFELTADGPGQMSTHKNPSLARV